MMFAHTKDIETDLIREYDLFDQVLDAARNDRAVVRASGIRFTEGVDAEFHM